MAQQQKQMSMIDTTDGKNPPAMGRSYQISQRQFKATPTTTISSMTETKVEAKKPTESQQKPAAEPTPSREAAPVEEVTPEASATPVEPTPVATTTRKEEEEEELQQVGSAKVLFNVETLMNKDLYLADRPMPYKFKTDKDELELKCELCLDLKCCPEHCCNWDTCTCKDCDDCSENKPTAPQRPGSAYRKVFNPKTWKSDMVETDEPEVFIRGDRTAQPEQFRPKKKVLLSKRDQEAAQKLAEDPDKSHTETLPKELVQTSEGTLIQNFEVDFGPEEELVMAGGIRGIRALRVQRDAIEQQLAVPASGAAQEGADRFAKYGGKGGDGAEETKQ